MRPECRGLPDCGSGHDRTIPRTARKSFAVRGMLPGACTGADAIQGTPGKNDRQSGASEGRRRPWAPRQPEGPGRGSECKGCGRNNGRRTMQIRVTVAVRRACHRAPTRRRDGGHAIEDSRKAPGWRRKWPHCAARPIPKGENHRRKPAPPRQKISTLYREILGGHDLGMHSADQYRPEIVDIRTRRPWRKQGAAGVESTPGIVARQRDRRIDATGADGRACLSVGERSGIVLAAVNAIGIGGQRGNSGDALDRESKGEIRYCARRALCGAG